MGGRGRQRRRKRWRGPRTRYARSADKSISFDRARTSCPTRTSVKPSKKPDGVSSVFFEKIIFHCSLSLLSPPLPLTTSVRPTPHHTTPPARPSIPPGCRRRSVFVLNNQYGEHKARERKRRLRARGGGGGIERRSRGGACPSSVFPFPTGGRGRNDHTPRSNAFAPFSRL